MGELSVSSKLNADWDFLTSLMEAGRDHAAAWLDRHYERIGTESTVDIQATYL
jgi:NTE family protein